MADCIACGAATPYPHGTASSQHYGRCPNTSVLSESTVGASNWGGSVNQIQSIFLHTTINWAMADCIACGAATPNTHGTASPPPSPPCHRIARRCCASATDGLLPLLTPRCCQCRHQLCFHRRYRCCHHCCFHHHCRHCF
jgi:hypothetical protein